MSDNLERAVSVVPEKYKVQSQGQIADNNESAKILNSLLEGVVMTQNQLLKVQLSSFHFYFNLQFCL